MKIHKIILAIATLALFTNILPKVYYDTKLNIGRDIILSKDPYLKNSCGDTKLFNGQNIPVLDMCIFLDRYRSDGGNPEKWFCNDQDEVIRAQLRTTIIQEEAIIASSIIIRTMIENNNDKMFLDNLNNENKWLKLVSNDKEFVVFIPKKKYPIVKSASEIEKIGLSNKILIELKSIDQEFYTLSEKKQQERINLISQKLPALKTQGLIKIETLLQIFSDSPEAKKIMKRIYLAGHGWVQMEKTKSTQEGPVEITKPGSSPMEYSYCAQISPSQYVKFLYRMTEIVCSFLYIYSCYSGGWNALSLQNATFYEQQNIFKKFETITEKIPYIIVASSSPDTTSIGGSSSGNMGVLIDNRTLINDFFIKITDFFNKQRNTLKEYLKTEKLSIPVDISETEILTGEFVKHKIFDPDTNEIIGHTSKISLIEQQPWLISSIDELIGSTLRIRFKDITTGKILNLENNLSSVRFPGAPFFRVVLKTSESRVEELEREKNKLLLDNKNIKKVVEAEYAEKISNLEKRMGLLDKNSKEYGSLESEWATDMLDFDAYGIKGLIETKEKQINDRIKEIDTEIKIIKTKKQIPNAPLKIDYQFLIKQRIETEEKISLPLFTTNSPAILIYPSVVNLSLTILNPNAFIMSMIPGRAQHYIKGIILSETTKKNKSNFYEIFKLDPHHYATKLFFVENLSFSENNKLTETLGKLTIKMENGNFDYIYKQGNNFYNKTGQFIPAAQAWKTIKNWILRTTPAREAIHEATAGTENIYKFRIKINTLFKDMFVYDKKHTELNKLLKNKSNINKIKSDLENINKEIEKLGKNNPKEQDIMQQYLEKGAELEIAKEKIKGIEPKIKILREEVQKLSQEGKLLI